MVMRLAGRRRDIQTRQPKGVLSMEAFGLYDPQGELRQPRFSLLLEQTVVIEIEKIVSFHRELFRHERLAARDCFPIDVSLRFSGNVGANPCEVVAFA